MKLRPFHNATGSGTCSQCGQHCYVDPGHPKVNHTAESDWVNICHGCTFSNATRAETQLAHGEKTPTGEPLYRQIGVRRTFSIWLDTRNA